MIFWMKLIRFGQWQKMVDDTNTNPKGSLDIYHVNETSPVFMVDIDAILMRRASKTKRIFFDKLKKYEIYLEEEDD